MRIYEAAALNRRLAAMEVFAAWPEALPVYRAPERDSFDISDLGVATYDAAGGLTHARRHAIRDCLFLLTRSLKLVDHVLDREYEFAGPEPGDAANFSYVGPLAALDALGEVLPGGAAERAVFHQVNQSLASVCRAQEQSIRLERTEENYWHLVANTTGILFRLALWLGLAGAGRTVAIDQLDPLASRIAMILQVNDDLSDAVDEMAPSDWSLRTQNIAILFAERVPHPRREEFRALLRRFGQDPAVDAPLREILFDSNAIGYCTYCLLRHYREARDLLAALPFTTVEPVLKMLSVLMEPCFSLLKAVHVDDIDAAIATTAR